MVLGASKESTAVLGILMGGFTAMYEGEEGTVEIAMGSLMMTWMIPQFVGVSIVWAVTPVIPARYMESLFTLMLGEQGCDKAQLMIPLLKQPRVQWCSTAEGQ